MTHFKVIAMMQAPTAVTETYSVLDADRVFVTLPVKPVIVDVLRGHTEQFAVVIEPVVQIEIGRLREGQRVVIVRLL